jgi:hypothetical protein
MPVIPVGNSDIYSGVLLMCEKNWPHIVYWDGYSPSASAIAQSPPGVSCMCIYQNTVVAAINGTNQLYWSDPGDIQTWPTTNTTFIESKWGPITALHSVDDKFYVFCEKGILYITGDLQNPPFFTGVLHPEIGATQDATTQYGTAIHFMFNNNLYTLDGSVNLLSDAIRDQLYVSPQASTITTNDEYIYVRPSQYNSGVGETIVYVFEKLRYGYWAKYTFPNLTGVGQSSSIYQAIVKHISYPWDVFMLAGSNGNLYIQPLLDRNTVVGTNDILDADYPNTTPVQTIIQTRLLDFGDRILTKQFRRIILYGTGTEASVILTMVNSNKESSDVGLLLSSTSLPCQCTLPVADGTGLDGPTEFQEMAIKITANGLTLQKMEIDFKPVRYNLLTFE